jgi:small subunit ribosomal protein S8
MLYNDLTRIKNAYLAKHNEVHVPYSTLTHSVFTLLSEQGYIGKVTMEKKTRDIVAELRYTSGVAHLSDLKFVSKPGRRLYARASELHTVRQGYGDLIVSTSQGIMTAREAKKKKLGGELLCEVF